MKLKEVMADPKFNEFLQYRIDFRESRPERIEEATRWKREPYDKLREAGKFTVPGILEEFAKIDAGTSDLSYTTREAITVLIIQTAKEVTEAREIEAQRKEARKLKNRVKRALQTIKGWLQDIVNIITGKKE